MQVLESPTEFSVACPIPREIQCKSKTPRACSLVVERLTLTERGNIEMASDEKTRKAFKSYPWVAVIDCCGTNLPEVKRRKTKRVLEFLYVLLGI